MHVAVREFMVVLRRRQVDYTSVATVDFKRKTLRARLKSCFDAPNARWSAQACMRLSKIGKLCRTVLPNVVLDALEPAVKRVIGHSSCHDKVGETDAGDDGFVFQCVLSNAAALARANELRERILTTHVTGARAGTT